MFNWQKDDNTGANKIYDIDVQNTFWEKFAFLQFPKVAEGIDEELQKYKKETTLASITSSDTDKYFLYFI